MSSIRPHTIPCEPEEFKEVCPYDQVHRILPERMQRHIIKCRALHPNEPKATCPYNTTHIYGKCEEEYHLKYCRDVKSRLQEVLAPTVTKTFSEVPIDNLEIQCDENWDNINVPTYNPAEHLKKNPILRLSQNKVPSKRKEFRENERRRVAAIEEQIASSTTSTFKTTASGLEDFRRPMSVPVTKVKPPSPPSSTSEFTSQSESDLTETEDLAKKMNEWTLVGTPTPKGKGGKKTKSKK